MSLSNLRKPDPGRQRSDDETDLVLSDWLLVPAMVDL